MQPKSAYFPVLKGYFHCSTVYLLCVVNTYPGPCDVFESMLDYSLFSYNTKDSQVGQTSEMGDPTLPVTSPMSSFGVLPCSAGVFSLL